MPVKPCQVDGQDGYKCGDEGKCYTTKEFGESAWNKACEQCTAIGASCTDENYGCPKGDWKPTNSFEGGENLNKDRTKVISKVPIKFEKLEELDDRFMRVKIWILNIGKNYNGSIFTKEAVQKALPSISLTPILGYIESNGSEEDFSDHRIVLEVDDEKGYKMKYLGSAYGVIPQDPNPQFELRENEYGGLEEYLTIEGILWTKFDEAVEIMNRDTIKYQSMELAEQYEGFFNDEGYFVFTDFKFFGCCILGKGVEPAIPQSTVEKLFTTDQISSIINSKLIEYQEKFEKKEDNKVQYEKLMKEYGVTAEQLKQAGITDYSKFDIDEFKEELRKIVEEAEKQADTEKQNQDQDQNQEAQNKDDKQNNPQDQNQNDDQDFEKGGDEDGTNKSNEDDVLDEANEENQEKNKSMDEKANENDEIKDIKKDLSRIKKDYESLKKEHDKLVEYKKNKEQEEHLREVNEMIAKFEMLTGDDVKEIIENVHKFSLESIEEKLFAIVGRKQADQEEAKSKTGFAKYFMNNRKEVDGEKSPSYDHYFTKHLKNN